MASAGRESSRSRAIHEVRLAILGKSTCHSTRLAARVRARVGPFAAVSDQSDTRLVLLLRGPCVRDVLAKGVPVDLHPQAFKAGDVACTLVAYINIQIDMLDDAPTYQLTAPRSMAGSFWLWLTAAAAEFGYEVISR